jgi:hypothetical protein
VKENYIIFWEYIKCVLPSLTEVMDLTMNLISKIHDFCERREYVNIFYKLDSLIGLATISSLMDWWLRGH